MAGLKAWVMRSLLAGGALVLWTSIAATPVQADTEGMALSLASRNAGTIAECYGDAHG